MTLNYNLTLKDKAIAKTFYQWTIENKQEYWTSDDFRRCRLGTVNPETKAEATLYDLFDDPRHGIGAFIAKLKFHGFIKSGNREIASMIPSNNNRKVDVWRWHYRVEGWLHPKTLEEFRREIEK